MASSLPSKVDLETMRKHLECPICFHVPRDGIMLQCRNGHNICSTCKDQLDTNNTSNTTKCPQGRCAYINPPTMNRIVADLVENLPLEFKCKYSKYASGCKFKGTEDMLRFCKQTRLAFENSSHGFDFKKWCRS
jgi:hypothetical protein